MLTANTFTEVHHATNPTRTRVTFDLHGYDLGKPTEFGVLTMEIRTSNGCEQMHAELTKHFLRGPDWPQRAAAIRAAFRNATLLP